MTRDEAVDWVNQILGFRTDRDVSIRNKMIEEQKSIEDAMVDDVPWFLHTSTTLTSTLEDGVYNKIALPTDYLGLREEDLDFWLLDATTGERAVQVLREDLDSINKARQAGLYVSSTPWDPEFLGYWLVADSIYVGPNQFSVARTFRFGYYKHDTIPDSNVENLWLKHVPKILIGKTAVEEATVLRDANAVANGQRLFDEGVVQLTRQNEARRLQGGPLEMAYGT